MTTNELIFIFILVVLGLNSFVFAIRIHCLLVTSGADPVHLAAIGWTFWPRVIFRRVHGFNTQQQAKFLKLRKHFLISLAILIGVTLVFAALMQIGG